MARWLVTLSSDGSKVEVHYFNTITRVVYPLGAIDVVGGVDATAARVLDWIFAEAGPAYGDTIHLPGARVLHYGRQRGAA